MGAALPMVAGSLLGSVISSRSQSKAANRAADAQQQSAQAGIDEQRRQFDTIQQMMTPFVTAGTNALGAQQGLIGLNGPEAQQAAINQLQQSPMFQSMLQQGNNSILANAAATGGLRGGNTQAALAQFSPQLLAQTINDQYSRLGGLTSVGQNAAALQGNAGMQTGNAVANLMQQQGAAQAGAYLSQGRATSNMVNGIMQGIGSFAGMQGGAPMPQQAPMMMSNPGLNMGYTFGNFWGQGNGAN